MMYEFVGIIYDVIIFILRHKENKKSCFIDKNLNKESY